MMDKKKFVNAMGYMRAGYPGMFSVPEDQWKASIRVFYSELSRFREEAVIATFRSAPTRFKDRFPTIGQFLEVVKIEQKSLESREVYAQRDLQMPAITESSVEEPTADEVYRLREELGLPQYSLDPE